MCTAVTYHTNDHYFGRNLDLEYSYDEAVTITPRKYPLSFRNGRTLDKHYAIIGMATVAKGYPLYYDATNEKGLSMAGLNFPMLAHYYPKTEDADNIAPFEFIPWILAKCANADEAMDLLKKINLWNLPFSEKFPLSPLHWIIADKNRAITVEPMADGLRIYENPIGVLTNNPPFDYHMYHLADYMNLSKYPAVNRFSVNTQLQAYSNGMGAMGLPGDLSSASRFVKAAFTKLNAISNGTENESVSQFFHILGSVTQQKGLVQVNPGEYEITLYASCCNTDKGIYYYRTYYNSRITAVDMHRENLDGSRLLSYPLLMDTDILLQNA